MNSGKSLLSQVLTFLPKYHFDKLVIKYKGNYKAQEFSCWEQYVCMCFAQLTHRESLRDIESCLEAFGSKLYHCGIKSKVSRSTLAYWNNKTDWKLFSEYAHYLIGIARKLYADDNEFISSLNGTAYAFDSTTIDVCLNLFPWAKFRKHKGAIKMHTLLDLQGNIPTWLFLTEGSVHDVNILDELPIEQGAYYVMDRGYLDYTRLFKIEQSQATWITRAKDNMRFKRQYSRQTNRAEGLICDQVVMLVGHYSLKAYSKQIRRIKYNDQQTGIGYVFITNNFTLSAIEVCMLYKQRWHIELFFKWIKQNLRIKAFFGTSVNAVYAQIWIAVSAYLLIAIIKKQMNSPYSMSKLLQILSVGAFEKMPLNQAFTKIDEQETTNDPLKQLILFD
jgi:transposase